MTTEGFEKSSVGWQSQQLQRQAEEWREWQKSQWMNENELASPFWDWINWSLLWQITKIVLIKNPFSV